MLKNKSESTICAVVSQNDYKTNESCHLINLILDLISNEVSADLTANYNYNISMKSLKLKVRMKFHQLR